MNRTRINRTHVYEQKIVDMDEYIRTRKEGWANCQSDSLLLWAKLRKAGAERCYGTRVADRASGDPKAKHYWVELKDKVYDLHGGVRQIIQRSEYYKSAGVECEDKCGGVGLMEHEMPLSMVELGRHTQKKWAEDVSMKGWDFLAQSIREKNNKNK